MGNKKKLLSLLSMFLLVVAFAIFSGNSHVNAMTRAELKDFIQTVFITEPYTDFSVTSDQVIDTMEFNNFNYQDFDYVFCSYYPRNGLTINFFFDNVPIKGAYSGSLYWKQGQDDGYGYLFSITNSLSMTTPYRRNYTSNPYGATSTGQNVADNLNVCTNYFLYGSNWIDETTYVYHNFEPVYEVIMQANNVVKYAEYDTSIAIKQLAVTIHGYVYDDLKHFVLWRYDNNEWVVASTDILSTGTDGFDIHYFATNGINQLPVGTYRYSCKVRQSVDSYIIVYSNNFTIDNQSILNPIDDNNVDTGASVDNIKDFLSGGADFNNTKVNSSDLEKAVDYEVPDNPYNNFIVHYFNSLKNALLVDTSDNISIKVHTWGQTFNISPSDFIPNYNTALRTIMTMFSTLVWCFLIIKWVTSIIESVSLFEITRLVNNLNERYSNLF